MTGVQTCALPIWNADAIVLVVGDVYAQYGETKDRADLALSGRQLELYRELRALGIPLVTVLLSSKPLAIPEIAHSTDALVCALNQPSIVRHTRVCAALR